MRLRTWADQQGISYQTALRWIKLGKFPMPFKRLPSGMIVVDDDTCSKPQCSNGVHIYARVSSHDQKADLERQVSRLRDFAYANGWPILGEYKEVASGMNDRRRNLHALISNKEVKTILVEHKDRLARFGVDTLSAALQAANRQVVVMNETESHFDIVQDFEDVVTSMCARIYGQRSSRNRAERAVKEADSYREEDSQ